MTSAGRYFLLAITFFSLSCPTARAQENWGAKAWDYLFGTKPPLSGHALTAQEIVLGLKRTLHLSTEYAGVKLGHYEGFAKNSSVRIPLPHKFQKAHDMLQHFGLSGRLDDLELQMNRAAENAVPDILPAFHQAIEELTLTAPQQLATGPDNAATAYFSRTKNSELMQIIRPIIAKRLKEVGANQTLSIIERGLHTLPMAPNLKFDVASYVSDKTLAGIYQYMARNEKKIREKPGSTRDPIIRQLFSHH